MEPQRISRLIVTAILIFVATVSTPVVGTAAACGPNDGPFEHIGCHLDGIYDDINKAAGDVEQIVTDVENTVTDTVCYLHPPCYPP
jgi:hypothetical protein